MSARQDFESALPIQTGLTQTTPVLPLSNEHGSQVKDQGRRQCCHNKHKKCSYRPTRDVSLLSWHASYITSYIKLKGRGPSSEEIWDISKVLTTVTKRVTDTQLSKYGPH